jgi:hypothetical protein
MTRPILTTAALAVLKLAACKEDVPQAVVDQTMMISQANAEKNAVTFKNKRYPTAARVLIDSDSSITAQCRFGDGWASGKLEMPDGTNVSIKCQTNGTGKGFSGCLTKDDFLTKDYANEEGHCNDGITSMEKFK